MTDTLWATLVTMAADDLSPLWDRRRPEAMAAIVATIGLVDRLRAELDAMTAERDALQLLVVEQAKEE